MELRVYRKKRNTLALKEKSTGGNINTTIIIIIATETIIVWDSLLFYTTDELLFYTLYSSIQNYIITHIMLHGTWQKDSRVDLKKALQFFLCIVNEKCWNVFDCCVFCLISRCNVEKEKNTHTHTHKIEIITFTVLFNQN